MIRDLYLSFFLILSLFFFLTITILHEPLDPLTSKSSVAKMDLTAAAWPVATSSQHKEAVPNRDLSARRDGAAAHVRLLLLLLRLDPSEATNGRTEPFVGRIGAVPGTLDRR